MGSFRYFVLQVPATKGACDPELPEARDDPSLSFVATSVAEPLDLRRFSFELDGR
jgi:hypothetical protein